MTCMSVHLYNRLKMIYCLTLLRSLRLSTYLPLDDNIYFHKVVGVVIVVQSVVHTLAHLANLYLYTSTTPTSATNVTSTATTPTYWECLFTTRCGIGWIPGFGFAYLSGVLLWVALLVIVVFSLPCIRRGGHFQVFYWTHSMFVVFWILLILHGPIFWMFFIAPATAYLLERIYRTRLFKLAKYGSIHITEMNLLPSKVTHLVIEKPDNFHHQPGDYVYVKIPTITKYEWHPFTISSSPEMPDHLWLHIRSMGDWTNKLYDFCRKYKPLNCDHARDCNHDNDDVTRIQSDKSADESKINMNFEGRTTPQRRDSITFTRYRSITGSVKRRSAALPGRISLASIEEKAGAAGENRSVAQRRNLSKKVHIPIYIDGPFGTSTREIFDTEHAVLIGGGVGITPYASILQSIMFRYLTMKRTCVKCEHVWYDDMPRELMKVKKVDFIWINRDQTSFEWFVSLLGQLEMLQTEQGSLGRILDMHLYMTAAKSAADLRGLSLQIALETMQSNEHRDTIQGLKTNIQHGRPDWDAIFRGFAAQNVGKVKVFACGPSAMMAAVRQSSQRYHFGFCKEHF
ncbi:NADPH oxidase 5 [Lamellibrachia satsuma]|nr:NADPH oxidase 5 [Lamellibrachia satsuma]